MGDEVVAAVVGEAVNKIASFLVGKHEEKSATGDNIERLEMAHIKMEAVLEISNKWQITDAPLMRWRKMLKRAADECDDVLHRCKRRAVHHTEVQQEATPSSFPKCIAHATKSFISSFVNRNADETSSSVVRRFERFANGADEFLRFVELGGTPRKYMFFDPLIGHLFAGKGLWHEMSQGGQYHLFYAAPMSFVGRGLEVPALFFHEDHNALEKNFVLLWKMRLSESTDLIGTTIKCLRSLTPHFKSTVDVAMKELSQLPMQDFSYVPFCASIDTQLFNFHNDLNQWFRPNPLCCKEYDHIPRGSNTSSLRLSDMLPEEITEVFLQCHTSIFDYKFPMSTAGDDRNFLKDLPPLKLGVLFTPHVSSKDLRATVESSALEIIDGEEQHCIYTNNSLHQLDNMLLPKAINNLYNTVEATTYEIFWKSKHGTARIRVEKTSTHITSASKNNRRLDKSSGWCPRDGAILPNCCLSIGSFLPSEIFDKFEGLFNLQR